MAKVNFHLPFAEISGTLGDFVFKKGKKEGEVILALLSIRILKKR